VQFQAEQKPRRIYVYDRAVHQDARIWRALKTIFGRNSTKLMAEFTYCRTLEAFYNRFAIVALRPLRSDQNVAPRRYPRFEPFQALEFNRLDPKFLPCRACAAALYWRENFDPGRSIHGRLADDAAPHDLSPVQSM
jgi:hypothetical protein